ncbi:MAG: PQQ-binding-like beta-propeller repeat protein [Acidobacteriota bacterium]
MTLKARPEWKPAGKATLRAVLAVSCLPIASTLVANATGSRSPRSPALEEAPRATQSDWPQFRGPNRDGISSETGFLESWPEDGPEVIWRVPLGEGFSGISVAGGRLYTMYGRDRIEYVACLDADSGEEIWRFRSDGLYLDPQGNGPRSTPVIDGGLIFALGARGKLHAIDADTGHLVWGRDLKADYGASGPTWGYATVPLVENDLLLVDVGGRSGSSIVAFNKADGKEKWRSQNDLPGYAAPIAITVDAVRQAVFFTGRSVVSLAPETGKMYWKIPWRTSYDVNAAAPVFVPPDKLFVSSGYDTGAALLHIETSGEKVTVEDVWRSRVMKNQFSSSVYFDGYIYGFDNSILKCIEADTGEMMWRARGFGHGSLFYADGNLMVLGTHGTLALIEATPRSYVERAKASVLNGRTWTVPTLVDGRLYLRNETEMIALDLTG